MVQHHTPAPYAPIARAYPIVPGATPNPTAEPNRHTATVSFVPNRPPTIAACSWSFRADAPHTLAARVRDAGVTAVQLHLNPVIDQAARRAAASALAAEGISIVSGMMTTPEEDYTTIESIRRTGGLRPTEHWPRIVADAARIADSAAELGLDLVTLHAGFVPDDPADPERAVFHQRLATIADTFASRDINLGLETGQESAETLDAVLAELDRPSLGVNFDPANMILYGSGDPIAALERLAPRVVQLHVKDARPPETPGAWGAEVPVGSGAVDWPRFFGLVADRCPHADLVIEREAGDSRVADIAHAAEFVRRHTAIA